MYGQFCDLYQERMNQFTHIKLLLPMTKAIQQHRRMTMAMLGGNKELQSALMQVQEQQEHRLKLLDAFANHTQLLEAHQRKNLMNAWMTIAQGWQQDTPLINHELHCHLVEQLLNLIAQLGKQLEQPTSQRMPGYGAPQVIRADGSSHPGNQPSNHPGHYPSRLKHLELLHFATRLMPSITEQIERIYALADHATTAQHCSGENANKLRYSIQCSRVNNEKLRHHSKRLEALLENKLPLLGQLKSYEIKLNFMLGMIESDILASNAINIDNQRLAALASDIINAYRHIMETGINLLAQWHEQDIEHWLEQPV